MCIKLLSFCYSVIMKRQTRLLILLVVAIIVAFYVFNDSSSVVESPTVTQLDADKVFDANHDDEMARRDAESEAAGDVSPTTDLLMPADEVDIVTEEVAYFEDSVGFLAYPQDNPNAPAVILIHEWRGLNEHIQDMARVVAANGYTAFAVDLYNGEVAENREQASQLSSSVDQEQALANLLGAEEYLREKRNAPRVASLGRCFGGAQSLNMSLNSESLDATVIYYGRLQTEPETLQAINSPILGIFAEEDGWIPPAVVNEFEASLSQIGKQHDITIYEWVDHAFANPTWGNFSQDETLDAWSKTLAFLEEHLMSDRDAWEIEDEGTMQDEENENEEIPTVEDVVDDIFAEDDEVVDPQEADQEQPANDENVAVEEIIEEIFAE